MPENTKFNLRFWQEDKNTKSKQLLLRIQNFDVKDEESIKTEFSKFNLLQETTFTGGKTIQEYQNTKINWCYNSKCEKSSSKASPDKTKIDNLYFELKPLQIKVFRISRIDKNQSQIKDSD